MVTTRRVKGLRNRGLATVDLVVAMAILLIGFFPLVYTSNREMKLMRSNYHDAVALEIVDGEFEALVAGGWRELPEGTHVYETKAFAFESLPEGRLQSTRNGRLIRLEWIPEGRGTGRTIIRELELEPIPLNP